MSRSFEVISRVKQPCLIKNQLTFNSFMLVIYDRTFSFSSIMKKLHCYRQNIPWYLSVICLLCFERFRNSRSLFWPIRNWDRWVTPFDWPMRGNKTFLNVKWPLVHYLCFLNLSRVVKSGSIRFPTSRTFQYFEPLLISVFKLVLSSALIGSQIERSHWLDCGANNSAWKKSQSERSKN